MYNKKKFIKMLPIVAAVMLTALSCGKENTPQTFDIYENHNVSACGLNDPLQNIEWLREFCEGLNDSENLSVSISIYKATNTNEDVFLIKTSFPLDSPSWYAGEIGYHLYWKTCEGNTIFHIPYPGTPPDTDMVEEFMADKEFIAEVLNYKKF